MNLFLDTSALVKIYHSEKGTENFTKFLSGISEELIFTTSDITKIELHSALLRKYRVKEITPKDLSEVFLLLDRDFQRFNIISVDNLIKSVAILILDDFGMKYSLSTLDSFQLASAVFSNHYSKINYFVASDKKLLNIAKEFFQTMNPEEL